MEGDPMPILEFACAECENRFDKLIRGINTEVSGIECPSCGSPQVKRQVSNFGVSGVWQSNTPEFSIPKMRTPSPSDPFNCIAT
jgi:putative FmdB family regulatory protein